MLRNLFSGVSSVCLCFLNEVLSLNAQEYEERKLAAEFVLNPQ